MKHTPITLVFFCIVSLMLVMACEKAEIQKSLASSTQPIQYRTCPIDDCSDCPIDDCCCAIEVIDNVPIGGIVLELCGTSSPCLSTMTCSAEGVGICPDINGFVETITLPSIFSRALFCVPQNSAFGIISASPSLSQPTVRITCQNGQTNPQTVTITLNAPPAKPFWQTNGDCELESCF